MTDGKRVSEAQECIKKAEKALKTSLIGLKFKPDFDSAASEYERAAVCYKNAGQFEQSKKSYLKAAENHSQNGILFHAAKCKEQAALLCKDLDQLDEAKQLMMDAADNYAESGTTDTSAMALQKAAAFFEPIEPEMAIQIYKKALLMVQDSDRSRMAGEFRERITKLCLRQDKYDEAVDSLKEEVHEYTELAETGKVGRLTTCLVLVYLAKGDSVAAQKAYQNSFRCGGFDGTDDAALIGSLIGAFEAADADKFSQCLQRSTIKSLDNDFLRLVKKLKCPRSSNMGEDGAETADGSDDDLK